MTVTLSELTSESESELLYDWRFTASHFILAKISLRITTSNFILQLNTCGYSPNVTTFLTRGWVCPLQLLLDLASAAILRSESLETHDHLLLSHIRDSHNLEPGPRIYIPQEQGGPIIPPGTGYPFRQKVKVKVTLRLTVSSSVSFGVKAPSSAHDQIFITVLTVTVLFLWCALSDERTGLSFAASYELAISPLHGLHRKDRFRHFLHCCVRNCCRGNVFTQTLQCNG
jgi:hypothetical protein